MTRNRRKDILRSKVGWIIGNGVRIKSVLSQDILGGLVER